MTAAPTIHFGLFNLGEIVCREEILLHDQPQHGADIFQILDHPALHLLFVPFPHPHGFFTHFTLSRSEHSLGQTRKREKLRRGRLIAERLNAGLVQSNLRLDTHALGFDQSLGHVLGKMLHPLAAVAVVLQFGNKMFLNFQRLHWPSFITCRLRLNQNPMSAYSVKNCQGFRLKACPCSES